MRISRLHRQHPQSIYANRWAEYRKRIGLTQRQLAAHLGYQYPSVAQRQICAYENGRQVPNLDNLVALAIALGIGKSLNLQDIYPDLYYYQEAEVAEATLQWDRFFHKRAGLRQRGK